LNDCPYSLGISTSAFFPRSLPEIFAILREQPLRNIELMPQAPSECRPEFADELVRHGGADFSVRSIHFPLTLQAFLYSPQAFACEFGKELCRGIVGLAGAVGAGTIVAHAPPDQAVARFSLERIIENVRYLCDTAAERGITVGLENLVSTAVARTPADMQAFAAALGDPNVGYVLDVTHAHNWGQDPLDFVEQLSPLVHIHASDYNPHTGQHRVPGDGVVHWRRLAQGLQRTGFAGTLIMELSGEALGANPAAALQRGVAVLQDAFELGGSDHYADVQGRPCS